MADHGKTGDGLRRTGEDGASPAGECAKIRASISALAEKLQAGGAAVLVQCWSALLQAIEPKSAALGGRKP